MALIISTPTIGLATLAPMLSPAFVLGLMVAAAPEATLERAVEAYEFGEHAEVVRLLEGLLDPLQLQARADVVRARAYLGAGLVLLGRDTEARTCFSLLLALAPHHELDPATFAPKVVRTFEAVRRASGLAALGARPPPPPPKDAPPLPPPSTATLPAAAKPEPSIAVAFVPFGVPQFVQGHPVRGTLFAVTEVGLFVAAALSFTAFEGLKQSDGTFALEDVDNAETLQAAYLTTFWSGVGVAALGIVDALLSHPGES